MRRPPFRAGAADATQAGVRPLAPACDPLPAHPEQSRPQAEQSKDACNFEPRDAADLARLRRAAALTEALVWRTAIELAAGLCALWLAIRALDWLARWLPA